MEVNGRRWHMHTNKGSCHDAAYLAQQIALRLARRAGHTHPVVCNPSHLITMQMRGHWKTRTPKMKAHRAACRRAAAGMTPAYGF
jgi:ribonuclease HI